MREKEQMIPLQPLIVGAMHKDICLNGLPSKQASIFLMVATAATCWFKSVATLVVVLSTISVQARY